MKYRAIYSSIWREFRQSPKSSDDPPLSRWVYRPIAMAFSPFLVMWGFSGNQVSLLGFLFGTTANVLFLIGTHGTAILAGICYFMFAVVDHADGVVARHRGESSHFGRLVDFFTGLFVSSFTPLCVAIGVANGNASIFGISGESMVIIGALACILNLVVKLARSEYRSQSLKISVGETVGVSAKVGSTDRALVGLTQATVHLVLLGLVIMNWHSLFPFLVLVLSGGMLTRFLHRFVTNSDALLRAPKP